MPKKKKKTSEKKRPISPESSDTDSSLDSELEDEYDFSDILEIVESHKSWPSLIRDKRLFEAGIFDTSFEWLREAWKTRSQGRDLSSSVLGATSSET